MSAPAGYKPTEGKREEFRKYLEKNGVMDVLTQVLVNLYEETNKPEDALEFIRDKMAFQAGLETYSQLKEQLNESRAKIDELEEEIKALKVALEPPVEVIDDEDGVPPPSENADGSDAPPRLDDGVEPESNAQ